MLFADFCNFLGKIWLRGHNRPIQNTAAFKTQMDFAADAYCAYRESDPVIDLSQGLDLEEALLVSEVMAGSPLTCLLNVTKALHEVQPGEQMRWLSPEDLVWAIRRCCRAVFDTDRN